MLDDEPAGLTRDAAEKFSKEIRNKMLVAASIYLDHSEINGFITPQERNECYKLLSDHLHDAIGDMPIWDIVKRGEA